MLKKQLQQVMEQIGCEKVADFPKHLIRADAQVSNHGTHTKSNPVIVLLPLEKWSVSMPRR